MGLFLSLVDLLLLLILLLVGLLLRACRCGNQAGLLLWFGVDLLTLLGLTLGPLLKLPRELTLMLLLIALSGLTLWLLGLLWRPTNSDSLSAVPSDLVTASTLLRRSPFSLVDASSLCSMLSAASTCSCLLVVVS